MKRFRAPALLLVLLALTGAGALLPARVDQVAREVEKVRGKRFERSVPASEIDAADLRKVLRSKLGESFPVSPDDTLKTLSAFGLIEETPHLIDRLIDFYASQVIAFYDPEPRRFYVVKGAAQELEKGGGGSKELEAEVGADLPGMAGMSEKLIFAHELTHALQDESLKLDKRMKSLKDNGDQALALESLLEGEATLVMVRVVLADLPDADEGAEEMLGPLLSAGALERSGVPKDIPDYFVEQLFFPYSDGTAYVRRVVKDKGWGAMDRLWKNPPKTTSEILHEGVIFTPAEDLLPSKNEKLGPDGGRYLYSDTLGEWTVRFVLRRELPEEEADSAASGWRGDRIAFFSSPRGIAYLWRVRLDSPEAAGRFEAAWKKARKKRELFLRNGRDVLVASGYTSLPDLPGFPAAR
ncbi:MAG TPA: hypothetical protein VKG01_16015 [Thermoanaerobaculia bacterium]|nr:hypothetical protein [Thermoanaerobaculia bacterium]